MDLRDVTGYEAPELSRLKAGVRIGANTGVKLPDFGFELAFGMPGKIVEPPKAGVDPSAAVIQVVFNARTDIELSLYPNQIFLVSAGKPNIAGDFVFGEQLRYTGPPDLDNIHGPLRDNERCILSGASPTPGHVLVRTESRDASTSVPAQHLKSWCWTDESEAALAKLVAIHNLESKSRWIEIVTELKADPALPEKIGMSVDRVKRFWFTNEDRIPVADLGKIKWDNDQEVTLSELVDRYSAVPGAGKWTTITKQLIVRTGIERTILSVKRRVENHINGRHPFPTKRVKSTTEQAAEDEAGTGGGLEAKYEIYYTSAENETPRAISKIGEGFDVQAFLTLNSKAFPGLTAKSKFRAGTGPLFMPAKDETPENCQAAADGIFNVEEFVGHRYANKNLQLEVKWENYDQSANSFEPLANLPEDMVKAYIVERSLARIEGGELDKFEKREKTPKKRKGDRGDRDRGDEKESKRSKKDKGARGNDFGGPIKSLSLKIKLGGGGAR